MNADVRALEELFAGWLLAEPEAGLRAVLTRLRPELCTLAIPRAVLACTARRIIAHEPRALVDIHGDLTREGHPITLGTLMLWHADAIEQGIVGRTLLDTLEDVALQRHVASAKRLPAATTGAQTLRELQVALERMPLGTAIGHGMPLGDVIGENLAHLASGIPSHYPVGIGPIDRFVGGFKPGDLVIVAARTGVGKTVLASRLARGLGLSTGRAVLYHTLEVGRRELVYRLLADLTTIENERLQRGLLTEAEREHVAHRAGVMRAWTWLRVLDAAGTWAENLTGYEHWAAGEAQPGMLVVDYIGLIRRIEGAEKRYQELGTVTRELKALARRHGCVVVAVSQLSREAAKADRPPQLTDLRESGDIEQDADCVLLAHAPKARPDDVEIDLDVIVAKNRAGRTGIFTLYFDRRYCRIEESAPVATWGDVA